jgi:hypothetical protein
MYNRVIHGSGNLEIRTDQVTEVEGKGKNTAGYYLIGVFSDSPSDFSITA